MSESKEWVTIPVRKETKARVKKIKDKTEDVKRVKEPRADVSYDEIIDTLLKLVE